MFRKGFLSQLQKIKIIESNLIFLCDFEKRNANFEVNIYKNWQIAKLIEKWSQKLQNSQKNSKALKNSQNESVLQVFIKFPTFLTILGSVRYQNRKIDQFW